MDRFGGAEYLTGLPDGSGRPPPEDEIFWQAAEEVGLRLSVHVSFGGGAAGDSRPEGFLNFAPINYLMSRDGGDIGYCMMQLINDHVFDRHPTLRIAFAECGAGWIPYTQNRPTRITCVIAIGRKLSRRMNLATT